MPYRSESFSVGLIYNNKEIIETYYKSRKAQSKEKLIAKVKKLQKSAIRLNEDYDMIISVLTDEGWRSDKVFTLHDEPAIFDPANYHYDNAIEFNTDYRQFAVFWLPKPEFIGNTSKNNKNDCLFIAIRNILEDKMPEGFRSPKTFKKRIGVERMDGVDICKMGLVEELMKININVTGEHTYTSSNKYNKNICLTLVSGHYSVDQKALHTKSFLNRKPIILYKIELKTVHMISLKEQWTEEFVSMNQLTKNYPDHFLVFSKANKCKQTKQIVSLKQEFDEFVEAREQLLQATQGFIDLYETPLSKSTAMHVFHHQARHLPKPEKILPLEASWIDNAFLGGLMYSNQDSEYDNAVCIDQNSQYAFNLSNKNFMIPIKEGKFTIMSNDAITSYAPYGIFRCVITSDDKINNRLFRFNNLNYYTHYDISNAIRLKFKIDLIQDGQANALLYDTTSRVKGDHTFGKTIEYLFNLKQDIKYAKKIISALWGGLCQKNKYNAYANTTRKEIIPANSKLLTIHKTKSGANASYMKNDNIFKSDFARVGPFLTSYCRTKISEIITKNFQVENIVRIHTDGFIVVNEKIPKELLSLEIGKFKIEHEGKCKINNTNNILWNN